MPHDLLQWLAPVALSVLTCAVTAGGLLWRTRNLERRQDHLEREQRRTREDIPKLINAVKELVLQQTGKIDLLNQRMESFEKRWDSEVPIIHKRIEGRQRKPD